MNKRLHTSARTTPAMRRAIQNSPDSVRALAHRYGINPKTVAKWRQRNSVVDLKTGPKQPKSTVLTSMEAATIVAFRQHVIVPLDDCLSTLQTAIPHLTRSSLHRCLQRHGISRQPTFAAEWSTGGASDSSVMGDFNVAVTELRTRYGVFQLFVAMELSSRIMHVALHEGTRDNASIDFLNAFATSAPCPIRSLITQSDVAFDSQLFREGCLARHIEHRQNNAGHWWQDAQLQRIEHTIKMALEQDPRVHQASEFAQTISSLVSHYNRHCKLRALDGLTPDAYLANYQEDVNTTGVSRSSKSWDTLSRGNSASIPTNRRKARIRNPQNTREAILEAARSCLAHDGPEGLSMAEVARIAGVNRGTAYQHFKTREKLIAASAEWVSNKLFHAVFGEASLAAGRQVGEVDVAQLIDRLSNFAMDNPELSRAWLLQVLSSPNPSSDQFWKHYAGSTQRFAATELAEANIDAEVLSVIMLAGAFLWPVWARAHAGSKENLRPLAHRFAKECLRISMYGNLRSEHYPAIALRLQTYREKQHSSGA